MVKKWEYLFVTGAFHDDEWRPRYINGQEIKDWKRGASLYDFANGLGYQGWELATATHTQYPGFGAEKNDYNRLIFKRPTDE